MKRCPTCGCYGPTWTKQTIVAAIHAWADKYGHPPKAEDWQRRWRKGEPRRPSLSRVQQVFGTWTNAVEAAGYPSNWTNAWSRERILAAILDFESKHGRMPRSREFRVGRDGYPPERTVRAYFGTWAEAIAVATDSLRFTPLRRVSAAALAPAIRSYLAESESSSSLLAEQAGVDASLLQKLLRGEKTWVEHATADRLLCAMDRTDLWSFELAEAV